MAPDPEAVERPTLAQRHADFEQVEDELNRMLTESLEPRSNDVLYDVVADLGFPPGARALDVGCGEGHQAVALAQRFAFTVVGVDPVPRAVDVDVGGEAGVTFREGTIEAIPLEAGSVDLVCREMLYLVADLVAGLAECRRVLRPGGCVVVYQLFATDWLEPREAERFWRDVAYARSADRDHFEASVAEAGLFVDQRIELGSETVEWAEEQDGKAGRALLAAARLLRDPDRYLSRFGQSAYDIKLNDALWHVYRMLGKLSQHLYVLRSA